jgi:hypothetical protein
LCGGIESCEKIFYGIVKITGKTALDATLGSFATWIGGVRRASVGAERRSKLRFYSFRVDEVEFLFLGKLFEENL